MGKIFPMATADVRARIVRRERQNRERAATIDHERKSPGAAIKAPERPVKDFVAIKANRDAVRTAEIERAAIALKLKEAARENELRAVIARILGRQMRAYDAIECVSIAERLKEDLPAYGGDLYQVQHVFGCNRDLIVSNGELWGIDAQARDKDLGLYVSCVVKAVKENMRARSKEDVSFYLGELRKARRIERRLRDYEDEHRARLLAEEAGEIMYNAVLALKKKGGRT